MIGKYGQHRNIILWRYIFCRMKIVAVIKAKMAKMFLSRGKWPIFEEQIIPIWNIWSLMVEIMVSWSDWCSQSNSPALSFTSLQHQEKCGKKLIGILDQITPDMYFCWYHNISPISFPFCFPRSNRSVMQYRVFWKLKTDCSNLLQTTAVNSRCCCKMNIMFIMFLDNWLVYSSYASRLVASILLLMSTHFYLHLL